MAVRRPSVRHRRGDAGVPQWHAGGADRHGRPCRRHRRHQGFPPRARDLRGGHPDSPDDAVSRRRAERRSADADRARTCARARKSSATSIPSSPPMRWAPSGCWRSWTITACTICARWRRWCKAAPKPRSASAIRALPDGVYTSEIWNNPLGEKLRYPLKITVQGDAIELDFAGAPPQLPQGGLNCTFSYTEAHATYPMKCLLSPEVRGNAGCYRPFTVKAPAGSDPELRQARLGEFAHARRLVSGAEHLSCPRRCRAGSRAGGHRLAGRGQRLRPRRPKAPSTPTISSWAPARAARRTATASRRCCIRHRPRTPRWN